jgi:Flp pilus assembly secretin CpaC
MSEARQVQQSPEHAPMLLNRAERLLGDLTGVVSARIVADTAGRIEEVHVLTDSQVSPKQTVRNVESALIAQLGIEVDHRKVSVAQTQGSDADAAAKIIGLGQLTGVRRYLFEGYEFERKMPQHIVCRVRLRLDGEEYVGSAEGTDIERGRLNAAAQAVLNALEQAEESEIGFALDGLKLLDAFDLPVVVAAVYGLSGRTRTYLAGAAPVNESPEHAAILATLKATNRWIVSTR